jgi:hypothetical protein
LAVTVTVKEFSNLVWVESVIFLVWENDFFTSVDGRLCLSFLFGGVSVEETRRLGLRWDRGILQGLRAVPDLRYIFYIDATGTSRATSDRGYRWWGTGVVGAPSK